MTHVQCPAGWRASTADGAYQSARNAVRLAPDLSDAHVALGSTLSFMGRHDAAVGEFERATQLNPNLADHHFAFLQLVTREPARAIQTLEAHMRLDPFYLPHVPGLLGDDLWAIEPHDWHLFSTTHSQDVSHCFALGPFYFGCLDR